MNPDITHRQRQIFGKGSRPIHAHALGIRAEVPPASEAVAAVPADDMAFAADNLSRQEVSHVGADLDDFPDELMPDNQGDGNGLLRPGIPFVNMEVGAAN